MLLTTPASGPHLCDDIVLTDSKPANIQRLDSILRQAVMQFLAPRQCSQRQHTFTVDTFTLEVIDSFIVLAALAFTQVVIQQPT